MLEFQPVEPRTIREVSEGVRGSTCVDELRWLIKQSEAIRREVFNAIDGGFSVTINRFNHAHDRLIFDISSGRKTNRRIIDLRQVLVNDDIGSYRVCGGRDKT